MNQRHCFPAALLLGAIVVACPATSAEPSKATPEEVLSGLKSFIEKCARPDGSIQPNTDPKYKGMSDSALSDLAPLTYAVTLSKTFGWKLPHEERTRDLLLARQQPDGAFVNAAGTGDPKAPLTRLYNTTQAVVALHALGVKPKHDPIPVFTAILKDDYKKLPAYTTSFFPLAYQCCGKTFPPEEDKKIRALMPQADDGYLQNHVAATFHAAHYYRLMNEPTPKTEPMLKRMLSEQKPDGSWMLNPPSRDRHATFDAAFTIKQLAKDSPEVRKALEKAGAWALTCRNADGGFGHYPGSPSDMDGVYFNVGTLVISGFLKPVDGLKEPHLLSWGHVMPVAGK